MTLSCVVFASVMDSYIMLIRIQDLKKIRYGSGSSPNFDTDPDPDPGKNDIDLDPDPGKKDLVPGKFKKIS